MHRRPGVCHSVCDNHLTGAAPVPVQCDSVTRDVSSVSVCVSLVLSTRDLGRVSAVPPQQRQGRARGGRHELVPAVETQ